MPEIIKRNINRRRTVLQRTGLSSCTIWRYEGRGEFPHRVVLSKTGNVGWYESEVDAWVADRVRAAGKVRTRDPAAAPTPNAEDAAAASPPPDAPVAPRRRSGPPPGRGRPAGLVARTGRPPAARSEDAAPAPARAAAPPSDE